MPDVANSTPLIELIGRVTSTPLAAQVANWLDGSADCPALKVPSGDKVGFLYCHEPMKAFRAFGTTNAFPTQDGALRQQLRKGWQPFCLFPNLRAHCPRCPCARSPIPWALLLFPCLPSAPAKKGHIPHTHSMLHLSGPSQAGFTI